MQVGEKGVKYGLQLRVAPGAKPAAAARAAPARKPSVFGDEDSDDERADGVEAQIARQAARKQSDKKVAELHAAALAEDAAIFDYDAHYDAIQETRAEPKKQEKLQRQSRYIAGLLEKAEERKREQDVLYERQLAKERAAEDHLYGDKERFVTAAYRAKLAERQAFQQEQKRKQAEEEANAVESRGHMGDFYRNLLRSNVAFGAKPTPAEDKGKGQAAGGGGGAAAGQAEGAQQQQQQQQEEEPEEPQWLPREEHAAAAAAAAAMPAPAPAVAQRPAAAEGERAAALQASKGSPAPEQQQRGTQRDAPAAEGTADDASAAGVGEDGASAPATDAAQRRNKEDAVAAARERYLARKRQKTG